MEGIALVWLSAGVPTVPCNLVCEVFVVAVAERLAYEDAHMVMETNGGLKPTAEDRTRRAVRRALESVPAQIRAEGS